MQLQRVTCTSSGLCFSFVEVWTGMLITEKLSEQEMRGRFTPSPTWYNQAATVELLLEEGADLLKKTKHYGTIGELANPGSHDEQLAYVERDTFLNIPVHTFRACCQFPGWSTVLHVAAGNGSEQTALALLQANHR
ncbi:hypothetical protein CEUSTIGMA_g4727.t1 [Chlamydomonas eustigma]|uniref:Uncharacterized protein n=1 Tax=Chlamydomonas eustigma TaxID=1157962 RepID=A0A250X2I7_9CHLO|nr:hypothetical protein CEUSTIGMA_g4727.t1 [Chlamydomonas eustigma]|eukprot:GAX77281.1 hypothetical protein CEUSTIGMA_g4727.t1 [Chlamydomonas eustigma]